MVGLFSTRMFHQEIGALSLSVTFGCFLPHSAAPLTDIDARETHGSTLFGSKLQSYSGSDLLSREPVAESASAARVLIDLPGDLLSYDKYPFCWRVLSSPIQVD